MPDLISLIFLYILKEFAQEASWHLSTCFLGEESTAYLPSRERDQYGQGKAQMKQGTAPPPFKNFQGLELWILELSTLGSTITAKASESVCSLSTVLSHYNLLLPPCAFSFQIYTQVKPLMHLEVVPN